MVKSKKGSHFLDESVLDMLSTARYSDRRLIGKLKYLAMTRSNIIYPVKYSESVYVNSMNESLR